MTTFGLLAGAGTVNAENALHALIPSGSTVSQVAIYYGALSLVAVGVFVWAIAFRGHRRRRHSHYHHPRSAGKHQPLPGARRDFRNLAETGGLPPIRTGQQPPSPA